MQRRVDLTRAAKCKAGYASTLTLPVLEMDDADEANCLRVWLAAPVNHVHLPNISSGFWRSVLQTLELLVALQEPNYHSCLFLGLYFAIQKIAGQHAPCQFLLYSSCHSKECCQGGDLKLIRLSYYKKSKHQHNNDTSIISQMLKSLAFLLSLLTFYKYAILFNYNHSVQLQPCYTVPISHKSYLELFNKPLLCCFPKELDFIALKRCTNAVYWLTCSCNSLNLLDSTALSIHESYNGHLLSTHAPTEFWHF